MVCDCARKFYWGARFRTPRCDVIRQPHTHWGSLSRSCPSAIRASLLERPIAHSQQDELAAFRISRVSPPFHLGSTLTNQRRWRMDEVQGTWSQAPQTSPRLFVCFIRSDCHLEAVDVGTGFTALYRLHGFGQAAHFGLFVFHLNSPPPLRDFLGRESWNFELQSNAHARISVIRFDGTAYCWKPWNHPLAEFFQPGSKEQ